MSSRIWLITGSNSGLGLALATEIVFISLDDPGYRRRSRHLEAPCLLERRLPTVSQSQRFR
ncbi:hypothetical protein OF83DRAFT_1180743 [Amylostereum chailletii]|nr:hypothetical protein OF83DRAFT_1180743 [Amylostereum chailletii]